MLGEHAVIITSAGSWLRVRKRQGIECLIHRCFEFLQIGFPLVFSIGPHVDFEALQ